MGRTARVILVVSPLVAGLAALCFVPPIAQDQAYHRFADARTRLGIPNFGDVI